MNSLLPVSLRDFFALRRAVNFVVVAVTRCQARARLCAFPFPPSSRGQLQEANRAACAWSTVMPCTFLWSPHISMVCLMCFVCIVPTCSIDAGALSSKVSFLLWWVPLMPAKSEQFLTSHCWGMSEKTLLLLAEAAGAGCGMEIQQQMPNAPHAPTKSRLTPMVKHKVCLKICLEFCT